VPALKLHAFALDSFEGIVRPEVAGDIVRLSKIGKAALLRLTSVEVGPLANCSVDKAGWSSRMLAVRTHGSFCSFFILSGTSQTLVCAPAFTAAKKAKEIRIDDRSIVASLLNLS